MGRQDGEEMKRGARPATASCIHQREAYLTAARGALT